MCGLQGAHAQGAGCRHQGCALLTASAQTCCYDWLLLDPGLTTSDVQAEIDARQKVQGQNLTLDQLNATLHSQAAHVRSQNHLMTAAFSNRAM